MADNPLLFNFYLEMLASAAVFCHRLPKRSYAYLRIPASVIVYGLLWWLLDTVLPLSSFPFGIEYILMLFALLDAYSDRYHTENETFNLILNETVMRCERAGIDFHCMADVPLLDGMRSGDLYSLLGNALENAVEAAAKCGTERYIRVNIASVAEMLSIHIENTFAGQLTTENGKLRSTKPDPSGHGFGVRSMEWIVRRYDGTMTFSDANGIFSEDILLPLPLARKKDDIPQTVLSR